MQDARSPMFDLRVRPRGPTVRVPARVALPTEPTAEPIYDPPPQPPVVRAPSVAIPEAPLIAILDAPLAAGETAFAGFARKEAELGDAFAALSLAAAHTLRQRLANPRPGDELAAKFTSRLTVERRNRLLEFLAGARRRAALVGVR